MASTWRRTKSFWLPAADDRQASEANLAQLPSWNPAACSFLHSHTWNGGAGAWGGLQRCTTKQGFSRELGSRKGARRELERELEACEHGGHNKGTGIAMLPLERSQSHLCSWALLLVQWSNNGRTDKFSRREAHLVPKPYFYISLDLPGADDQCIVTGPIRHNSLFWWAKVHG
jgi:hypothetical protein